METATMQNAPESKENSDEVLVDVQHLVKYFPVRAGLTAPATPSTTASLIASLTYGDAFGAPNRRSLLVSFSVNSSGTSPSQYR